MFAFVQKKPHPALLDFVQGYWQIEGKGQGVVDFSVPDGFPELFFVFSEQLKMPPVSGSKNWSVHHEAGFIGQATSQFSVETSPFVRAVFVKLYPWSPFALFGVPAWRLNDQAFDLGTVTADPDFRSLKERMGNAEDFADMTDLLDAFFLKRIGSVGATSPFLRFAIKQIYHSNGTVSVDNLTTRIRASRRHVEKVFKEKIGLSPKYYAQLIRVKKASMYLLDPRFRGNICSVAAELDYYDQSHFMKDFKAVVRVSPSDFMRKRVNMSPADLLAYLDQWDYS